MEDVSQPDMEGKTIALTSCTVADEARDVFGPEVMLHWNDMELSTDSYRSINCGSSNVVNNQRAFNRIID